MMINGVPVATLQILGWTNMALPKDAMSVFWEKIMSKKRLSMKQVELLRLIGRSIPQEDGSYNVHAVLHKHFEELLGPEIVTTETMPDGRGKWTLTEEGKTLVKFL